MDIRRFAPFNGNNQWLHDRVGEILGLHYEIPWPNRELASAPPVPPLSRLPSARAARAPCSARRWAGSEPTSFAPPGEEPCLEYTWGKPNWLRLVERTSSGRTRSAVTVFDETSFGKLMVTGRDAESVLQRLCTADVAVPVGRAVYTGMLNERGGYEADVTVTRLAHDRYLLVTSSASVVRDLVWIERHVDVDEHVAVVGRLVVVRRLRRDGSRASRLSSSA